MINKNEFRVIMSQERAQVIANEVGERATVEPYDEDGFVRLTISKLTDIDIVSIFHAGMEYGMNKMARHIKM